MRALIAVLLLTVHVLAGTVTWTSAGGESHWVVDPPRGEMVVFPDGIAVLDGGPTLAIRSGCLDLPQRQAVGTVQLEGFIQGNGTYEVAIDFGTSEVFFVRPRSPRVSSGAGSKVASWILARFPGGRGVRPVAGIGPNPWPRDQDAPGSSTNVSQVPPLWVEALTEGRLTAAQASEVERLLRVRAGHGTGFYWSSGAALTASEARARGWIFGTHGYRAHWREENGVRFSETLVPPGVSVWARGGGFAKGLYSSVLPPGVGWVDETWRVDADGNEVEGSRQSFVHGETGSPNANGSHFSITQLACTALFTNDAVAARFASEMVEAVWTITAREARQERTYGWMLSALGWLGGCVAPYDAAVLERTGEHLTELLDWIEATRFEAAGVPWYATWARVPSQAQLEIGLSAGMTQAEVYANSRANKVFMTSINVTGVLQVLDLFDGMDGESRARLHTIRKGLRLAIAEAAELALIVWPDGQLQGIGHQIPEYVAPGLPINLQVARFGWPGGAGVNGVGARFVAPALAELILHGYSANTDNLTTAFVTLAGQINYWNATPTNPQLMEYMGPVWSVPDGQGGYVVTYGLTTDVGFTATSDGVEAEAETFGTIEGDED